MRPAILAFLILTLSHGLAAAAELQVRFGAIESILARQVFTEDGRKYVRGGPRDKCSFAYLEHPRVTDESGKLAIRARFSGRSALDLFGHCVGLGDSFDLRITAVPYCRDGVIGLRDVKVVSQGKDGYYIRRVCAAMTASLAAQFRYPILEEARKLLEVKKEGAPFSQEMVSFRVPAVRVEPGAVVLTLDFVLAIR